MPFLMFVRAPAWSNTGLRRAGGCAPNCTMRKDLPTTQLDLYFSKASSRLPTCSFLYMLWMWAFTVLMDNPSRCAISLYSRPLASRSRILCSRVVRHQLDPSVLLMGPDIFHQSAGNAGAHRCAPLRQLADGLQQGDRGGILEHVSIGTGLQGLGNAQVIIMHGEDHELYVGQEGAQLPQQLDAVGAGQADIAYHHVQIQLRDGREGLLRASLGVQELHIFSTTQEPFQMGAHLHEILHHGDADRRSHGSKVGRFTGDGACTRTLLYSASGQGQGPLVGSPWHDQFQPGTLPRL